jgi:hypothetical protein
MNETATVGQSNRALGWISMAIGAGSGLIMGLWSFDGPIASPLGEYGDTSRRLARLGHIAFFGLGMINLHMARELPRLNLTQAWRHATSFLMNFGNIFLPLTLFGAAMMRPVKYAMSLPATAILAALILTAYGVCRGKREGPNG